MKKSKKILILVLFFIFTIILFYINYTDKKHVQLSSNLEKVSSNKNNEDNGNVSTKDTSNLVKVDRIDLPDGFTAYFYATNIPNARSMVMSDNGILYVGTRSEGKVYAVIDENNDGSSDYIYVVAQGLNSPNGVAYKDGNLYVAEISRIIKFSDIDNNYKDSPSYSVVYGSYPKDAAHGWKYIAFGSDGKLYVPVGAPCNICDFDAKVYAIMTTIDVGSGQRENFAQGIRNSVGFDWDPITGIMWFTDNGRDWLGDDLPPDELNKAEDAGNNYGFPYCYDSAKNDPEFGDDINCENYTNPEVELGPHVASLGMTFYTGGMFPEEYKNKIFIAEHGSWNRTEPIGYRISTVDLNEDRSHASNYSTFAKGWLNDKGTIWGRPVDVIQMVDGSLLVSDDFAGSIYRIVYEPVQ